MRAHHRPQGLLIFGVLATVLVTYGLIFLRYLPNSGGAVGADYSLWLPDLLVGYFWHLNNGWFSLPWFSPAQCGGVPFYADPEVPYLSLPQFLTFIIPPTAAVQLSALIFAAVGFAGAHYLAKVVFRLSASAAVLAGTLFMFNNFSAARLMVGHLTFEPFLLTPIIAWAILLDGKASFRSVAWWVRVCLAALVIAIMIQGGAVHVLPPALLSVAILALMHAIRFGANRDVIARFVGAVGIACALSAGKLAASIALIGNLPRDQYPLPGIAGLPMVLWRAFQTLFIGPPEQPEAAAVHSIWAIQRHEWEYGVSIIPVLLMLAWLTKRLARPRRPKHLELRVALVLLLAVPVSLNWYQPGWNSFLKSLPFLGNSSNLLRWFAAYILPACLGGALALDAAVPSRFRPAIATLGVVFVVGSNALTDRSFYGPHGQGGYQVDAIEAAWHAARQAETGPRITAIRIPTDQRGHIVLTPNRDDALAYGYSQLLCYEPLFGYNLERFPIGALHPGPALESHAGVLNVKNPACYVFPGANACAPGDPFPVARIADAEAFLDYEPFPFKKPLWARLADGVSLLTAGMLGLTAAASLMSVAIPRRLAFQLYAAGHPVALWLSHTGGQIGNLALSAVQGPHEFHRYSLQIGAWLRRHRRGTRQLVNLGTKEPRLDLPPATEKASPIGPAGAVVEKDFVEPDGALAYPEAPPRQRGLIEVVLPGGVIVRVDEYVDAAALDRVLTVLSKR